MNTFGSITTKYLGPTNSRGARIRAVSSGGVRAVYYYQHDLTTAENHKRSALALVDRLNRRLAENDVYRYELGACLLLPDANPGMFAFQLVRRESES